MPLSKPFNRLFVILVAILVLNRTVRAIGTEPLEDLMGSENSLNVRRQPMLLNKALGFLLQRKRGSCCSCTNCNEQMSNQKDSDLNEAISDNGMDEEPSESNHNEDVEMTNLEEKGSSPLMSSTGGQKRRFRVGLTSSNNFKQHNSLLSNNEPSLLLISAKGEPTNRIGNDALASSLSEMRSPMSLRGGTGLRLGFNNGLGNGLGSGLGIGSSLGIYDNVYPTGSPKPAILRRKLLPNEGILLLEVEDQLPVDGLGGGSGGLGTGFSGSGLGLGSGFSSSGLGLGTGFGSLNGVGRQYGLGTFQTGVNRQGFGRPKFSVQLNSEMKTSDSNGQPVFNRRMMQPQLSEKTLEGFSELSKDPHENGVSGGSPVARLRNVPMGLSRNHNKMLSLTSEP